MAQAAPFPSVPLANGGPISDTVLEQVIQTGRAAQSDAHLSDAQLTLIWMTFGPMAEELLHRRRAMGVIADMTNYENVTFLKPERSNG